MPYAQHLMNIDLVSEILYKYGLRAHANELKQAHNVTKLSKYVDLAEKYAIRHKDADVLNTLELAGLIYNIYV